MKKLILVALVLASSAQASVSSPSLNFSGYIQGVVVRSDLQEARVVVTCGAEKGSIVFSGKNYAEGLALINSTGKYLEVSMFKSIKAGVDISEYSVANEQEILPGTVLCK